MPSWNELLEELDGQPNEQKSEWLRKRFTDALAAVSARRDGRNVLLYASAFLQKPALPPPMLQLTHEEINGFMSVMYGMDWERGLTLILHTPGGVTNAAETLVAYLWTKFHDIEVIIPTYAMSAGTMLSLAANRLIMGRQSQLGPIDPQMPWAGRAISARAVVDQFEKAKADVMEDQTSAHVWAPVLQTIGPSLLQEAENALAYGEEMVANWLAARMFRDEPDAAEKAKSAARHFNDASMHKSHGRRIDRDEARSHGIVVVDLEEDQGLQDTVLTAYHLATLGFEKSTASKILQSNSGRSWLKNFAPP